MRFLTIFRPTAISENSASRPSVEGMSRYAEEQTRAGVLLSQGMLDATVSEVRLSASEYSVGERVDPLGGFAFIEAASRAEAVEHVKAFLQVAGDGTTEIRQVLPDA